MHNFRSELRAGNETLRHGIYPSSFPEVRNSVMGFGIKYAGRSISDVTADAESSLDSIDDRLDFVIIAERFQESLVLIRRSLRWRLIDMVYETFKSRPHPHISDFPPKYQWAVKKMSSVDDPLYNYGKAAFERRIESMECVDEEVALQSCVQECVHNRCVECDSQRCGDDGQVEFCSLLGMEVRQFHGFLRAEYASKGVKPHRNLMLASNHMESACHKNSCAKELRQFRSCVKDAANPIC